MSGTIKSKTKGNVFVENMSGDPITAATVYVENAPSASAFTGSTKGDAANVKFIGSGTSPKLKLVASGTSLGKPLSVSANTVTLDSLVVETVYGGALLTDAKGKILTKKTDNVSAVATGDVTLNILNGRYGTVYGGGAGFESTVNGDVTINYGGGKIADIKDNVKTIYGGGAKGAIVTGDVSININAMAVGKIGSIYAGGNGSVVKGDATVTFAGGQGLYSFSGTVSGGGKGKNARVEGTSTLVFDGYIGDFKATIKEFDSVVFTGATSVTLTKGQNSTMKGATYNFVITDDTRGLTNAMLTLTKKTVLGKVNVSIASADFLENGGTVILIASKYFKTATDINVNTFSILNNEGNKIYSGAYELEYNYDKKLGGNVTFIFKGSSLIIDGEVKENITLTDADETLNVVAGAEVVGNIDMGDGDDKLNIQSGAKVYGDIDLGGGNDYLVIQKDSLVTGTIDAGTGDDTIVLQKDAMVSSEIFLRSGTNLVILEEGSQHNGTLVFEDGATNTVHVNGGAISSVRGGDKETTNTFVLSGIEGLGGGVGVWTTDRRGNKVFQARELVLKGETKDTVILNKFAEVSAINFGKGEDTLVLNQAYDGDVIFEDGNDAIVAGTNLTLDGNKLKLRGTDNVLVVMNGCTVTITNMTVGSFKSGSDFYGGIYLSQNAGLIYNNLQYIQNYVGHLDTTDDVVILAAGAVAPNRLIEYYTKQTDGVVDSILMVNSLMLVPGAKLDNSSVLAAGSIYAFATSVITNSNLTAASLGVGAGSTVTGGSVNVGALSLEEGAIVTDSKISTGDLDMAAGSTVTGGSLKFDGTANVAGTVGTDLLGSANKDVLNVLEGAAFTTNMIDLGGGNDVVNFKADFTNDALVIANVEKIKTADDTLVTIGSSADTVNFVIGKNSMLTEVIDQVITVGDWDKAVTFLANYTIVLTGIIDTDVALNGNTVMISDGGTEYFARNISLTGTNTFMLGEGVETWYDWQQFSGDTAKLAINLGENALFAIDGYMSDADRDQLKANTTFSQNSALGLGSWITIKDWSGAFSIDNLAIFSTAANIYAWNDLEVMDGGKIWGSIEMNNDDNEVVLRDGVVVNGSRTLYDFGTIDTGAGDDTLTAYAATVYGKITMGSGDNTLTLDGTIVNKAINQKDSVLEVGDFASNNDIEINNAYLGGDVKFSGATEGSITDTAVTGDLSFGDGDDMLTLTGVDVSGDLSFGAGDDEVILDDSKVEGDVVLNGGDFAIGNGTEIGGDLDYVGGFTQVIAGDADVAGDILFGTGTNILSVEGAFTAESLVGNAAAQGNSVTAEAGGVLTLNSGDIELTATGGNLVGADGGTINMAGDIILNGALNDVVLMNGGSINGLGALEMTGDNMLYVEAADFAADSVLMDGAGGNSIVETAGSIAVAGAIVMDGTSNTVDTDTSLTAGALFMTAETDNTVNVGGSMSLNGYTNADGDAVPGVLIMTGVTNELNVTGDLTADNVKMTGTTNTIDNAGTVALNDTAYASVSMEGDNSIVNSGDFTATNITLIGDNSIANSGAFTATGITMIGGDNSIANSDAFTADDIVMTGSDNTIANSGAFTAADITMTSEDGNSHIANSSVYADMAEALADYNENGAFQTGTEVFTAGNVVMDSAEGNSTLVNTDVMNLESLSMTADTTSAILNANELNVAGDIAMESNANRIVTLGTMTAGGAVDMVGTGRRSENTIAVDGDFTADSVSMDGYANDILMGSNAVLTAANGIEMNSRSRFSGTDSNEISLAKDFGTIENEELVIDDVNMVVDTALVAMTGSSNLVNLGLEVTTDGTWDDTTVPASHLVSRATVGAFNVAVAANGALTMEGGVNTLNVGYTLISDEEGEILVNGDASIAVGDVTMTGSVNTIDAAINLYAGEQAFIDMNGKNVEVTLGDILMDTDPANGVNTDAVKTNTVTIGLITDTFDAAGDVTTASGEIRNDTGTMTTTAGDISMFGAGAVNTLTVGRNASVGNIAMGNVKGDQASKSNTLDLDASGNLNGSIRLIAETNDINLQGTGTIDNWFDVFGGVNTATIGKDVTVNDVLTFGGVYDQDGIGVDGYELIKNTANTVNVYGTVGGIDTSVSEGAPAGTINASDDTILVDGGIVNGDILTGFGTDSVRLDNAASVTGDITMGDASIALGNTDDNDLRVLGGSSVGGAVTMIAGDDNDLRVRGGSAIEGEVVMTAGDDNDLRISGASRIGASVTMTAGDDNDLRVTGGSKIAGAVTMTADDDNDLFMNDGSVIEGAVTMTATGGLYNDNDLTVMNGSAIEGEVTMTADDDNDLYLAGASRIGASVTMTAGDENDLDVVGSEISGNVSMIAGNDNTATIMTGFDVDGNLVGSHVAGDILMDSAEGNNYLTIAGDLQVVAGEMDVLTVTTVDGKITMLANTDDGENHLRLEYTSLGGDQVLMQGYLADVTIKTGDWKIFGATTVDSSTYMDSFHMDSEVNTFTVEEGTVVVTGEVEDPTLAGYGMAFTGRENTLNIDAKGKLIMADTAADMTGPNAPVPFNVDPTTGRNGIYMGWSSTDITDPTDDKYSFTGVTFYGVDPQNGQEVYTFTLGGGTPAEYSAIISDFNNINVDGKLLTGAVDMLGLVNMVVVSGPAESTVGEAYPRPPMGNDIAEWATWMNTGFSLDALLKSTSTLWAESMSFSGQFNTLIVAGETDSPSMYLPTLPVSGASLMVGGAITMGNATVALYDKDGNYVKDGTVLAEDNLIAAGGMEDFTFFKSGDISMTALYSNKAYISGYVFRGYADTNVNGVDFDQQDPFYIKGEVNGGITQTATEGTNVLELELVDVTGDITQVAAPAAIGKTTANTLEIHGTVINELFDINTQTVVVPEEIVRSSAGNVSQTAQSDDDLIVADNSINATWSDLGNVTQLAENGSNVITFTAVNAGDVTMDAEKLDILNGAFDADNTITADNVGRLEEVSNFGNITMTAVDTNTIDVAGYIQQAVVGFDNELVTAPGYTLSEIASLTMDGTTNTATLDLVNVAGNIDMTAGEGGNMLVISGGGIAAYDYMQDPLLDPLDPANWTNVPAELVYSEVGGSITMEATDSDNTAMMVLTNIAGDLTQDAYATEADAIVDNTIGAAFVTVGNVEQFNENGSNMIAAIALNAGDVTMDAEKLDITDVTFTADNTITADNVNRLEEVSNFGNITMTAVDTNTIEVSGYIQDADVDPITNGLISAPDYLLSEIASLTMVGTTNDADLSLVDVAGDIAMTAGEGGNTLVITGGTALAYDYMQDPAQDPMDPANWTEVPAELVYSEVGGDITMEATDGNNLAMLAATNVAGDVTQNALTVDEDIAVNNGLNAVFSSMGNVTQSSQNGSNRAIFVGTDAGDVSMTAEKLDITDVMFTAGNTLRAEADSFETVSNFGAITMTAADTNLIVVEGYMEDAVIVANELISAPDYLLSEIDSLTMDGTTNMAVLELVDVEDNIAMTAVEGGNGLRLTGAGVAGYTYWTDPADPQTETTVPAGAFYSEVGGGITMDATDAVNAAFLGAVIVAGDIAQNTISTDDTIFGDNEIEVYDSFIANATQTAANGDNAMYFGYVIAGDLTQTAANGANEMDLKTVEAGALAQTATDGDNLMLLDDVLATDIAQTATSTDKEIEADNEIRALFSTLGDITQWANNGSNTIDFYEVDADNISMTASALDAETGVENVLAMTESSAESIAMSNANGNNNAVLFNVDILDGIDMDASALLGPASVPLFLASNYLKVDGTFNASEGTIGGADWVDANDDDFSTIGGDISMDSEFNNNTATLTNTNVTGGIDMTAGGYNTLTLIGAIGDVDVSGVAIPTVFATTVGADVTMTASGTGAFTTDMYGVSTITTASNSLAMEAATIDADVTILGDVNLVGIDANSTVTGTITFGDAGTVLNRLNEITIAGSVDGVAAASTTSTATYQVAVVGAAEVNTIQTAAGNDLFGVGNLTDSITITSVDLGAGTNTAELYAGTETITINNLWATNGSLSVVGDVAGSIFVSLSDSNTAAVTNMTVTSLSGVTLTAIGSVGDTLGFSTSVTVNYVGTALAGTIASGAETVVFSLANLTSNGAALMDATNLTSWDALKAGGFQMDVTGKAAGTYNLGAFDVANWGTGTFSLTNGTTLSWNGAANAYQYYNGIAFTNTYTLAQDASDNVKLTIA